MAWVCSVTFFSSGWSDLECLPALYELWVLILSSPVLCPWCWTDPKFTKWFLPSSVQTVEEAPPLSMGKTCGFLPTNGIWPSRWRYLWGSYFVKGQRLDFVPVSFFYIKHVLLDSLSPSGWYFKSNLPYCVLCTVNISCSWTPSHQGDEDHYSLIPVVSQLILLEPQHSSLASFSQVCL